MAKSASTKSRKKTEPKAPDANAPARDTAPAPASNDAGQHQETDIAAGELLRDNAPTTAMNQARTATSAGGENPNDLPGNTPGGPLDLNSPHNPSISDDATRKGLGIGGGAPDGVIDTAAPGTSTASGPVSDNPTRAEKADPEDPPRKEGDDVVVVSDEITWHGNKARLWRMLEKGATKEEMLDATGWRSVVGTINSMARSAGRDLEVSKGDKPVYKLKEQKGS